MELIWGLSSPLHPNLLVKLVNSMKISYPKCVKTNVQNRVFCCKSIKAQLWITELPHSILEVFGPSEFIFPFSVTKVVRRESKAYGRLTRFRQSHFWHSIKNLVSPIYHPRISSNNNFLHISFSYIFSIMGHRNFQRRWNSMGICVRLGFWSARMSMKYQ